MISPGIISIDLESSIFSEDIFQIAIPIIRTEGSDGVVSVDYSINDGTATAGQDFTAISSGTLIFEDGETVKELLIEVIDDTFAETSETINIAIGNTVGASLGLSRTAIVTIQDNDTTQESTLSFGQAEYSFSEDGGEAVVTVIRTGNSNDTVSVEYDTKDDYAKAGLDYSSVSGILTFEPGETSKTITVPLIDDELLELDEALTLTLNNPQGIELGINNIASLVIEEDQENNFNFRREVLVSGLEIGDTVGFRYTPGPTAFDWTPDNKMFIARLHGQVAVYDDGELLEEPFIDMTEQVNTGGQRGLLGIAVHPEFSQHPYVYLAYSYDPPGVEQDLEGVGRTTRLVRVEADPSTDYTTALPDSEVILLETPPVFNLHAAGAIHFGDDGSLFWTHGDGTQVGGTPTPEQVESLQRIDNPFGKMFRIDPITGEGYSDNPFYNGDISGIESKIYSYGHRNPWRFTIHPETGEPFSGDVGWTNWEEINTGRGVNFGWPLFEGGNGESTKTEAIGDDPDFQYLYDEASEVTPAIYAFRHRANGGSAVVLGDFYTGTAYPELYNGALFYANFNKGDVNALIFNSEGNVDSAVPFLENERGLTQIAMGADSNLYFSNLLTGEIGRWVFEPEEGATITGTSDKDILEGTVENELILGLAGNDLIQGNGGADTLDGGEGLDTVTYLYSASGVNINLATGISSGGNAENDSLIDIERILGSNFADEIIGDDGNNLIQGNNGADTLEGGAGVDVLSYRASKSEVSINLATNTAVGGDAEGDVISGFERILGSDFADYLVGDDQDNLIEGNGGADTLEGGAGKDILAYNTAKSGVNVNLTTGMASGGDAEGDVISSFEWINGSKYSDYLVGDFGDNRLNGGADDDKLKGVDGNDSLNGGDGRDTLDGGAGSDFLDGGAGIDFLLYGSSDSGVMVDLEAGFGAGGDADGDVYVNIERIIGSNFADHLIGDDNDNLIEGNDGADTLEGGAGKDVISYLSSDSGVTVSLSTGLGAGGDAEGDIISGFEQINGSKYSDNLTADEGNNRLNGRAGNDILDGGLGQDTLKGGAGSDLFIISPDSGVDRIIDLNLEEGDLIGLSDGLAFEDLSFTEDFILAENQLIAIIRSVDTNTLTSNDFISV
ncbi:MAG: PQQ-dependent sugar dehydrogenase [Cyanobacteria bacterium P01_G01_bin.19]